MGGEYSRDDCVMCNEVLVLSVVVAEVVGVKKVRRDFSGFSFLVRHRIQCFDQLFICHGFVPVGFLCRTYALLQPQRIDTEWLVGSEALLDTMMV